MLSCCEGAESQLSFLGSCIDNGMCDSFKGVGSRNVNKLISKRRFCSIFDRSCHSNFPHVTVIYFLKMKVLFRRWTLVLRRETNETIISCMIAEILVNFRNNFSVESSHPSKSVQNTMATCVQQYKF